MNKKIIEGEDLFFKDDVQIVASELEKTLNLPAPPLFQRDELQIIYKGHVYVISRDKKNSLPDTMIKIYTQLYGLEEAKAADSSVETIKSQEDKYFNDNADYLSKAQSEMISKSVVGLVCQDKASKPGTGDKKKISIYADDSAGESEADDTRCLLTTQIGSQLVEKIEKLYSVVKNDLPKNTGGNGSIPVLNDGSEYNTLFNGSTGLLIVDRKMYYLETIMDYIKKFETSFEPTFFKNLCKMSQSSTPEQVSDYITKNTDKVNKKAFQLVRNKIWHSHRSFKLYLDGAYFVPDFKGTVDSLEKIYTLLLEKKIKIEGVKKYL